MCTGSACRKALNEKTKEKRAEKERKAFPAFHPAGFLRFMAANLSLTQLGTYARPR
jgi:hypothetical protein